MNRPKVIYYRWAYSPTTGDVTLAHNHEGHPTELRFHSDMAKERPESDLLFGYAHRNEAGWTITDGDSRPPDDPHVIESVERAIEREERVRKHAFDEYTPYYPEDGDGRKWAWIEGQPVEFWKDSELGDGDPYEYDSHGRTVRDESGDSVVREDEGVRAHFEVLVELALKDPQLQAHVQQYEGVSYGGISYANVSAVLNKSGKKWAIGTEGYFDSGEGIVVGIHGPTTTKQDVEQAIGQPVIYETGNIYGVKNQRWEDEDLWNEDGSTGTFSSYGS